MYIPSSYAVSDRATLFAFVEQQPLGILVSSSADGTPYATHLPLLLERERGAQGTLLGHFARANPHHQLLASGTGEVLAIFPGPDAYVTPAWYPSKEEHGKVVPTWNYVAVHAYGTLRLREDEAFLRAHLDALTARHESAREVPWRVSDAPAPYVSQLLKAIVGFELAISRLEGKWKMSQNRPAADIDGVVEGLGASGSARDREVAGIIAARKPTRP
jgi:transcriptional regulator